MRQVYDYWSLGELCDILDNKRKPVTKRDRVAGNYPYYGATGILDYVKEYIFDEKLVLIGEDGAKWGVGESTAFLADGRYWVNNHAHVIRPHRDTVLDKWIVYYLNHTDLTPFVTGLTVPKLNQGKLREIPIPLPPISEQKRIVAILDEAFEGIDRTIANTKKNLANARELFESYLNAIFTQKDDGWIEKKLQDILIVQPRNGWSPPAQNHSDTGIPVVTLSSVTGFQFNKSKVKFTNAIARKDAHYWLKNGELLISRSNTTELVGHVAICEGLVEPTICCDLIMKMQVDPEQAYTRFVYWHFRTRALRELISSSAQGANPTMKKINKSIVQNLPVVLPKIHIQKGIIEKIGNYSVFGIGDMGTPMNI